MATIKSFIKNHPVLTYFAAAFAISTGGILMVVISAGLPLNIMTSPILPLALFAGPSVASLLLTGLVSGRAGYRDLLSRLFRWRVDARWYAVAILTTPLVVTPILLALSRLSPEFLPAIVTEDDKATVLLLGIVAGLMGGVLEELGWTGFAVPRLQRRYSAFTTGLIVAAVWAVWHAPITYWSTVSPAGVLDWSLFLPPMTFYVAVLPAFRMLMVWVYNRTESLLVAMLMHTSLAACTFVILLPPAQGMSLITYYLVLAAALWGIVAAVRGQLRYPRGLANASPYAYHK